MEGLKIIKSPQTNALKVFGVVELFENIALRLPLRDLLFAQAVCKTWYDIIQVSRPLQKAFFFEPASSGVAVFQEFVSTTWSNTLQGRKVLWPPSGDPSFMMLRAPHGMKAFAVAYRPQKIESDDDVVVKSAMTVGLRRTKVFINPLLLSKFAWFREFFWDVNEAPGRFYELNLSDNSDLKRSAQRPDASWRRMLITQPPLGFIDCRWSGNEEMADAARASLVKMGHVIRPPGRRVPLTMEGLRVALAPWAYRPLDVRGVGHWKLWTNGSDLKAIIQVTDAEAVEDKKVAVWW